MTPGQRLLAKTVVVGDCWEWTGGKNPLGYGHMHADGWNQGCHRIAHTLWIGPIPKGYEVDHLCRNRACINPDHLEAVTKRENIARSNRDRAADRTHCMNGHEYTPENTGIRSDGAGRRCRACARAGTSRYDAKRRAAVADHEPRVREAQD